MNWEELTSDQFPQAAREAQSVCLLPMSCIERHAHHLPVGTDRVIAREMCRRAAALEPAIIFPDLIFTQILEAQHGAGTIAVDPDLMLRLLDNVCREISRNGLKKIVIVNAHGGNYSLIRYFLQIQLATPRDYVVYNAEPPLLPEDRAAVDALLTSGGDHAGEVETSLILAIRPDLVHRDQLKDDGEGLPLGRLKHLTDLGVSSGIWWYADHPTHYAGDGNRATAEKGELLLAARGRALAAAVRAVKQDTEAQRLQDEFYARRQHD